MNHNIIGLAVSAATGLIIAFINYLLSKKVLESAPSKYSLVTVARQIIQIGFLVTVYFVGSGTGFCDPTYLLTGAVVGITLPMLYFTKRLLKINDTTAKKPETTEKEKEDEADG